MTAKDKGYQGEACGECGSYTLSRNGSMVKCDTCGATSGGNSGVLKLPPIGTVEGPKGSFS